MSTTARRLILKSLQSPGDVVMLTAAVRDLHRAHPGRFETDVRTSAAAIWQNNPHLVPLDENSSGVEILDMHYPLVHQSNQRPYHFIHGYIQYLEQQLGVKIPVTEFRGDVHLSPAEKDAPPPRAELGVPEDFWIVVAGGKYDFTAKWWNPASHQAVVDHFRGRIHFVQCGEACHWHPRLDGVTNLVGKTSLREFIRLVYHADGVVCPVTFAMHLAAAVDTRPGKPKRRAAVVIAGGREPAHWEAYSHHQFISNNGALPCCAEGGCWKSRCQPVGHENEKDVRRVCDHPVQVSPELRIPKCMNVISPRDVIRRIETYYEGGALKYQDDRPRRVGTRSRPAHPAAGQPSPSHANTQEGPMNVLIRFRHGLGDAVQLTVVLRHLAQYHPQWEVDVAALVGKHSAYHGLCRNVFILDRDVVNDSSYDRVFDLAWNESQTVYPNWPSTKAARSLLEDFRLRPIPQLCAYTIRRGRSAQRLARQYLGEICKTGPNATGRYPAVLIHYQGNTSRQRKDLPDDLVRQTCEVVLRAGAVPVILDWDHRAGFVDRVRIHNPGANHALWGGTGTGDAEVLAALIEASVLMIGVDSGPLHVAGTTATPTLGVWTHNHPIHFFDLADNVLHLVPENGRGVTSRDSLEFFENNYRHWTYRQLDVDLPAVVEAQLAGKDVQSVAKGRPPRELGATSFSRRYYQEHRSAGLDFLGFGWWQQQYGRWLIESLGLRGKRVLDVGCACGSLTRGLGEAGAVVEGIDVNEYTIQQGRRKWPDMARLLHVSDAVNLQLFQNAQWDAVHAAQVAEHWKPELVPHILRELRRVVLLGGLLFCVLDTEEAFTRQNRRIEDEDPTHVCIRPMAWWRQQLAEAGWEVCSGEFDQRMKNHAESFLKRYDWDWFLARKV